MLTIFETKKGSETFTVGHLSIGYLFAKASSKSLNVDINLPLVFFFSLLPDADLLFPSLLEHRGITHSLLVMLLFFAPLFAFYGKRMFPYFAATVQHSLVGDFIMGYNKLMWPLSNELYGLGISMFSLANILIEWSSLLLALLLMLKVRDLQNLLKPRITNILLVGPSFAIISTGIFGVGKSVPFELLIPHLTYLSIMVFSILKTLRKDYLRFLKINNNRK